MPLHLKTKPAPSEHYALRLGRYVSDMQLEDLPEANIDRLASLLLYGFSVAMADHGDKDFVQKAMPFVHDAPGVSDVISAALTRSAADAAAINGALMTARSQTDTHSDSGGHLGCVVIPAILALAQQRRAAPRDVIAALAAGYELPPRVGKGCVATATVRGFRGTSLFGVFGSAAGCARVIGLDPVRTAHALSIAANFAGGLTQCYEEGTPEAIIHVAHGSRAGVVAALLAERGVTAAEAIFEGPKGFYSAFGNGVPELSLDGWTLPQVVLKTSPGCVINQMPVQTLLELVRRSKVTLEDVAGVTVFLNPENARYPGIDLHGPFPSKQGAIMSAAFMVQVALENGRVTIRDFLQRFGEDPIHERSRRVSVVASPDLEQFTARIQITLRNGKTLSHSSPPASSIAFGSTETAQLCRVIAGEWPADNQDQAFERLKEVVAQYVHERRPDGLDAIFAATRLRIA